MSGYTKLFGSILDSSVWGESDQTRLVWVTMLVMADKHGEVHASIPGLARRAGVSIEAAEKAIEILLKPDPHSRTKDNEGRRIATIDGGWEVLNHGKYRRMASIADQREKAAERQQRQRDRAKRDGTVTERDASRSVTPSNAGVTVEPYNADAEAETETKNTQHSKAPDGAARASRFKKPTREELDLAAAKLALPQHEVDAFVNHYESNGWKIGRNPMKSWPHALASWAARKRAEGYKPNGNQPTAPKDTKGMSEIEILRFCQG